ncbi:MAG: 16S rRNA (adenine(1518)-N(6)/adenine(1519)-N(6))-dimethyltransferase RsmA [Ignavibacteria bacterium]|jgi:16S rRNA (adenine1518-N6/adenine1519-N6)-dimethyltransferase|nr:16S rRNA (adenine(1518)-N(6)/adenine(1519)-N(6))-dimethyltransferase RsmA [Ignavibacteria bacterium]
MLTNREKYEKYRPKKHFGQNFLVDDNISRKIVNALEITDSDLVVEIGPGQGALTKHLIQKAKNFIAVEIDRFAAESLTEKFGSKLYIITKDFLEFDFVNDLEKFNRNLNLKVIGNIPYNITSDILFKLLDNADKVRTAVLMIQREVAERLYAERGTKQYGILAVQFQAFADVKKVVSVPPTAFFPKPDVHSTVFRIDFRNNTQEINDKNLFREFVRKAFSKRRKTLKNSLKEFFETHNIKSEDIDFDFGRRAESLEITEFITLSNRIAAMK